MDGLRAIALAAVLLFHLGVPYVPRGFIGVDIFFVISGYLITKNIRFGLEAGNFSILRFYRGRIMRLFPALLVTVLLSTLAAALVMTSQNAMDYGASAVSALLAYSNYYYLSHVGYFDAAAETKPLLHTWSLSVEWQFYAIWPLAMMGLMKWSRDRGAVPALLVTCLASMAANVFWVSETATTFYSTPFRVFEFTIGALAVWLENFATIRKHPSVLLAFGLACILAPILTQGIAGAAPLQYGLVPCVGAALVILTGGRSPLGRILTNPVAVFFGRVSYSTYLVHWPLITIYSYLMFRKPELVEALFLGATAVILGVVLYYAVELPFWKGKLSEWRGARLGSLAKVGIAAFALIVSIDISRTGWIWRVPPAARSLEQPVYGGDGFEANTVISVGSGPPRFIIAGDSHALQFAHGLDESLKHQGISAIALFDHGCMIAPNLTRYGTTANDQAECTAEYERLKAILARYPLPLVMAFNWPGYRTVIGPPGGEALRFGTVDSYHAFLLEKLKEIRKDAGTRPFAIIGTVPGSGDFASAGACVQRPIIAQAFCRSHLSTPVSKLPGYALNRFLQEKAAEIGVDYIDLSQVLCPNDTCVSFMNDRDIYSDQSHLSRNGSEVAAAVILRYVLRLP